ncbi:hypothetical protein P691DRAFT_777271 [Macrolepiota fuliginosa MF-IS2]|uniref:MYND-type domain-containing protein n=1 Tax=Macrolepiota fuliginosa MF-IS2 TaxID=1400762 RepID=A0A9P5X853_9AGAR|nr:hypothetical protein P691DRAFT_777271 [Macrolepiota fuliginosa MF-IS2]
MVLVDGVEFDPDCFYNLAMELHNKGCPTEEVLEILDYFGTKVLSTPTVDEDPDDKLTREDMAHILRGMKVDVAPDTKLSTVRLQQRLHDALDVAQRYSEVFEDASGKIDPGTCPSWGDERDLARAFDRPLRRGLFKDDPSYDEREDAFPNLSCSVYVWAKVIASVVDTVCCVDEENLCVLILRIISTHAVDENTPLILVAYRVAHGRSVSSLKRYVSTEFKTEKGAIAPDMPATEQRFLEFYLALNATRLSDTFKLPEELVEERYKFGFILPTGELQPADVARLNEMKGCALCGEPGSSRCNGCKSIQYCSEGCQKEDWKVHKTLCRAVSSGNWVKITLEANPWADTMPGGYMGIINHPSNNVTITESEDLEKVPPNRYGDQYYLVKLQAPMVGPQAMILVYDVHRSFQLYFVREKNPIAFQAALWAMGDDPRRLYRWAQRIVDWEWRICFDCAPVYSPRW